MGRRGMLPNSRQYQKCNHRLRLPVRVKDLPNMVVLALRPVSIAPTVLSIANNDPKHFTRQT